MTDTERNMLAVSRGYLRAGRPEAAELVLSALLAPETPKDQDIGRVVKVVDRIGSRAMLWQRNAADFNAH